ncbi:MAG: M50 family metallopeptidase [Deltaproteobacteria bacterium]|nr:M50 family metallopeptidase [Deltaproteobacteria bacterium]
MSERGFWTVARLQGTPLRLHWSLPLGVLAFSRFRFDPGAWLGIVLVVIAHELGHSVLVRRARLQVESIDLHGMGGECRYSGYPSAWDRAVIAWGGVLAQALLLPLGFFLAPQLEPEFLRRAAGSFGVPSLWMIALNLLPIAPLDGHEAWKLPRLWLARRRSKNAAKARAMRAHARREAGRAVAAMERKERIANGDGALPEAVAEQIERAVRRAYDEREPRK